MPNNDVLHQILNAVMPVAATIIATVISMAVAALFKRFGIANNADQQGRIDMAIQNAVGEAYRVAILKGQDLTIPVGQKAAVTTALNYLANNASGIMKAANLSVDMLQPRVAAALGHALNLDPTVTTQIARDDATIDPLKSDPAQPSTPKVSVGVVA